MLILLEKFIKGHSVYFGVFFFYQNMMYKKLNANSI